MLKGILKWGARIIVFGLAIIGVTAIVGACDGNRSFVDVFKTHQEQQVDDKTNEDTTNDDQTQDGDDQTQGEDQTGDDVQVDPANNVIRLM